MAARLPYGDNTTHYNDAAQTYGQRPLPYPRKLPVTLTVGGLSVSAEDKSHRIKKYMRSLNDRFTFRFKNTGEHAIDEHQEVILASAGGNVFGGFVETFNDWEDGPFFWYDVTCVSYAWLLQGPNKKITKVWESGVADSDIIADLSAWVPEIDFETHVDTIQPSLERFSIDGKTPWQILEQIQKITGGEFRVDYGPADSKKAYLWYYAPGSKNAPFELMDDPTTIDYITYFDYHDFRKTKKHSRCTSVRVEGRPIIQRQGKTGRSLGEADGVKTRFDIPYKIYGNPPEYKPLIWDEDNNALKVGSGDAGHSLSDYDVLWYFDDMYLEFAVAPGATPSYAFYYDATEIRPTIGEATDADLQALYGQKIVVLVKDESIRDDTWGAHATAEAMAASLLARWTNLVTYSCYVREHGLEVGDVIAVTNARRSLAAEEFLIQQIDAEVIGESQWKYTLQLNTYIGSDLDVYRQLSYDKAGTAELEKRRVEPDWIVEVLDGSDPVITYRIIESGGAADDKFTHGVDDTDELWKLGAGSDLDSDTILIAGSGYIGLPSNNELRFCDNGNYVGFEAPALAADQIWVLPMADGNANEVLQTSGAGILSWGAGGGEGISPSYEDLALETYSVTDEDTSILTLRKSNHATFGTLAQTNDSHILGRIDFKGVNAAGTPAWANGAYIEVVASATAGAVSVPAEMTLAVYDATNDNTVAYLLLDGDNKTVILRGGTVNIESDVGNIYLDSATDIDINSPISFSHSSKIISAGAITAPTKSLHEVDTEGSAASDDLDTIGAAYEGGSSSGQLLVLKAVNDARTVVVKHNTGNIMLAGGVDFSLDSLRDTLFLMWEHRNQEWIEISRSSNA